MPVTFAPIGIIYTPFKTIEGMPIQPKVATGVLGQIILKEKFKSRLLLDGFFHIMKLFKVSVIE